MTQLDEIRKMTSIVLKMEGDLNSFENGRRHHFFYMEDDLSFSVMEGDLKFFENGRQPNFVLVNLGT